MTTNTPQHSLKYKNIKKIEITARKYAGEFFSGKYRSAFKGTGLDFFETRQYINGDDARLIDWNVTARMRSPHIKLFTEERSLNVIFVVDVSNSMNFSTANLSKINLAAEVTAMLALTACRNNDKSGLLFFTDAIEKFLPPKSGRAAVWKIIESFFSYCPNKKKTDIRAALNFILKICKRRSIVFFISDFFFDDDFLLLKKINFRHDVICISLADPMESRIIKAPVIITLKDLESGYSTFLDLQSADTAENFSADYKIFSNKLNKQMFKNKIDFITLSTVENYIFPLYNFFKKRKR